jgi:hypothetical protein
MQMHLADILNNLASCRTIWIFDLIQPPVYISEGTQGSVCIAGTAVGTSHVPSPVGITGSAPVAVLQTLVDHGHEAAIKESQSGNDYSNRLLKGKTRSL